MPSPAGDPSLGRCIANDRVSAFEEQAFAGIHLPKAISSIRQQRALTWSASSPCSKTASVRDPSRTVMTNQHHSSRQLPFKGLVLAPDETIVSGFELPNNPDGMGGRSVLVFTEKRMLCCPTPRTKLGFMALSDDAVLEFHLSHVVGATKRLGRYYLLFLNGEKIMMLLQDLEPLLKVLNPVLGIYCGKEVRAKDHANWEVSSLSTTPAVSEAMLAQLEASRTEFIQKHNSPEAVRKLQATETRARIFNSAMVAVVMVFLIVFTVTKCSSG